LDEECFGFGGGPGQAPHLATTYAATMALVTVGTKEARDVLVREDIKAFLMSCKDRDSGGFRVHEGGELDVRGSYAALATAVVCGIEDDALTDGVGAFVRRCQSYEGGIGGEPGGEAHGGYTYCGLAACALAGATEALDLEKLERWLTHRQGDAEGGFNGRTNKLVDGCYSFWQGGCFPLLSAQTLLKQCVEGRSRATHTRRADDIDGADSFQQTTRRTPNAAVDDADVKDAVHLFAPEVGPSEAMKARSGPFPSLSSWSSSPSFASAALQGWILGCCQSEDGCGGLRDKPGTGRDHYHTCYCLSGLSIAQHYYRDNLHAEVLGLESNALARTVPALNVVEHKFNVWMSALAGGAQR